MTRGDLNVAFQAKAIPKNADIKGLLVKDTEIKLSQYADDTTLILDGSEKSLSETLRILESFEKVSGLRLNSKKTEALWIGSCAGKSEKLRPEKISTGKTQRLKCSEFGYQLILKLQSNLTSSRK